MVLQIAKSASGDDALYSSANTVPSLDLRFASTKTLNDYVSGNNLVTFTRASSATYFDSAGVLQTARTNLLLRSEEFDNASWSKVRASISANSVTAPNGTLTADTLIEDSSASTTHFVRQDASVVSGASYTFSLYAQASTRSQLQVGFGTENSAFADTSVRFTLSGNGTATTVAGSPSSSIVNVGGGWYRCTATATATATATGVFRVFLSSGNTTSYTGDGTSGLYLWGAQLEQGSSVSTYLPTTSTINSAPRFDHNPTTGESLGLLVEESRTNLNTNSEALDTYVTSAGSVSANQGVAPDGTSTADEITSTGGGVFKSISGTTASTVYTASVFAKYISGGGLFSFGFDANPSSGRADFNLQTGALGAGVGANVTSRSITPYGNGWYRCSVTATVTSTSTIIVFYSGTSGAKWLCWGAQLEAGSFPTSYIPTTTATATRSADVASISGSNFSSWYRQDEGTVFANALKNYTGSSAFPRIAQISDSTNNNALGLLWADSSSRLYGFVANGGSTQVDIGNASLTQLLRHKSAFATKANDFAVSNDGLTVQVDTSGSMPAVDRLFLGKDTGASYFNGTINRIAYWSQRLSDSTLQTITQ